MGLSQDSASTQLWLGIFWLPCIRFCWKSWDSDSIGLDFSRLGLARTQKGLISNGSFGWSLLAGPFWLVPFGLVPFDSHYDESKLRVETQHRLNSDSAFFGRYILDFIRWVKTQTQLGSTFFKTQTHLDSTFSDSTHHYLFHLQVFLLLLKCTQWPKILIIISWSSF